MPPRRRADIVLVERGLFESRAKAQAAIAAGLVTADEARVRKPSDEIAVDAALRAEPAFSWVSRGGVKLAAALDKKAIGAQARGHGSPSSKKGPSSIEPKPLLGHGPKHLTITPTM